MSKDKITVNMNIYDIPILVEELEKADKEINKLNNIIDELEKYIGAEWYCFDNESVEFEVAKDILNKLQELKGSDSNGQ